MRDFRAEMIRMITFKGICQLNIKRNYGFQTLTGSLLIVKMKRAKGVPETTAFREEHISTKVASAKKCHGKYLESCTNRML